MPSATYSKEIIPFLFLKRKAISRFLPQKTKPRKKKLFAAPFARPFLPCHGRRDVLFFCFFDSVAASRAGCDVCKILSLTMIPVLIDQAVSCVPLLLSGDRCGWFQEKSDPGRRPAGRCPCRLCKRPWRTGAAGYGEIPWTAPHPRVCRAASSPPISGGGSGLFRFW